MRVGEVSNEASSLEPAVVLRFAVWRASGANRSVHKLKGTRMSTVADAGGRISTGMSGLDDILGGGFDPDRMYLVEGTPGSGKTTLALQFLLDGVKRGEKVLYITLSESESELRLVATRHGWSLDGVPIFQLVPPEAVTGRIRKSRCSIPPRWSSARPPR